MSVAPSTTASDAVTRLMELEAVVGPLLQATKGAQQRHYRVSGIGRRRAHSGANLDYIRGRYHGLAIALAVLGGFELADSESDLLEFLHEISPHLEQL